MEPICRLLLVLVLLVESMEVQQQLQIAIVVHVELKRLKYFNKFLEITTKNSTGFNVDIPNIKMCFVFFSHLKLMWIVNSLLMKLQLDLQVHFVFDFPLVFYWVLFGNLIDTFFISIPWYN